MKLVSFTFCFDLFRFPIRTVALLLTLISVAQAGELSSPLQPADSGSRYGWLNLLDHRSAYGQDAFPEPFLVDDSALETDEVRLDWFHSSGPGQNADNFKSEIEKGFGLLTLELEVPYELNRDTVAGQTIQGVGNIDLGARHPVYQFVSANRLIDTTFGVALEVGIPTNSSVSKNTELVPKIFNDLKIGRHFTLQSIIGYSMLYGGGEDGGLNTFEYGFVFGYAIPHKELPIPGVLQLTPVLELKGETQLNKTEAGHNSLIGDAAIRLNLKAIGAIQPRIGVGVAFPIDNGGREDMRWGIITSLVFEY